MASATIPADNEWFAVSIRYTAATKRADLTVKRADNTGFIAVMGLNFSGLTGIGRVPAGEVQGETLHVNVAMTRVDDIGIDQ